MTHPDESRPYQPHPAAVPMSQVERQDDLTIGSLCSGYGGLEMGLQAVVGGRVAWHVEYDKHPSAVLAARFPGVPNHGDITTTDWSQVEPVDWLTAGYPCQPFSSAGKRKGSADERHLWPFVADAVGALRPGRVLLENVAGHVSLGLDAVLWDLAALGYDATWGVIRAADAGAPHSRARIFIVASDARHESRCDLLRGEPRRPDETERPWEPDQDAADTGGGSFAGLAAARDGLPVAPERGDEPAADASGDGRNEGGAEPAGIVRRPNAAERRDDTAPDTDFTVCEACGGRQRSGDARRLQPVERGSAGVEWGAYGPAIRRWERVTGRPVPRPTEPGRTGERLSPRFVEWMQGLPDGWVTDTLPRNPALKALGNGVVPQQAALAVRALLSLEQVAA